jgi:diguanylate cyclase (GGDEF)-like protein
MNPYLDLKIGKGARIILIFFSLLIVAFIGLCDYNTEADFSFYVLYSIPIFMSAWYLGSWSGFIVALSSAIAWWIADFKNNDAPQLLHYLDALLRLVFFIAISLIISLTYKSYERERNSAHTDFLTGLPNRRTFIEQVSSEIARAKRYGRCSTIAYIDLDDFKLLNDRFGHAVGDKALQQIAIALRQNVRKSDLVARMGGDEFLIFLPETNDSQGISSLTHLQSSLIQASTALKLPVTFTIGAVTYDVPTCSAEDMIKTADRIMYCAKREGKNKIKHINIKAFEQKTI